MDGKPVIVPIHLNAQGAIDVQNEVASAFGADYIRRIIGDNGENVLYTKNNEDSEQLLSKGRPVPQAMADDVLARNSIPNTLHNVNQQYGPESSIGNGSVGGGSVGTMRSNYNYQRTTEDAINQFNQNVNNRTAFVPDNPLVNMLPTVSDAIYYAPGSPAYLQTVQTGQFDPSAKVLPTVDSTANGLYDEATQIQSAGGLTYGRGEEGPSAR